MSEPAVDLTRLSGPLQRLTLLRNDQIEAFVEDLSGDDVEAILSDWAIWARPEQVMPAGDWRTWLILCGRGWGKTRTGGSTCSEVARDKEALGGGDIIIAGRTWDHMRKTMIEGPAGILASAPADFRPVWFPGKSLLVWPNGVKAECLSGDTPEAFRGPNAAFAWLDELSHYDDPKAVWDNLQLALRLGMSRAMVTTTPLPDLFLVKIKDDESTVVTEGSTYDNVINLSPVYIAYIRKRYEGTNLGEQEIHGKILMNASRALWRAAWIERSRVVEPPRALDRIVIAIDPWVTDPNQKTDEELEDAGECGMQVCGKDRMDHGYQLEDLSGQHRPEDWAKLAVAKYEAWEADAIVGEINNGGALVEAMIRAAPGGKHVKYIGVHASRGKFARAEPIASMSQNGMIHHVGKFRKLEHQQCNWEPGKKSPDRMDAHVWGMTELLLAEEPDKEPGVEAYYD